MARRGIDVRLLARTAAEAAGLESARELADRLPGHRFPDTLRVTADWAAGLSGARAVLFAVPSNTLRENARRASPDIAGDAVVVSACKGLESGTLKRMSTVLAEELGVGGRHCVLSGPNLAREVVQGHADVDCGGVRRPGCGRGGATPAELVDVPGVHEHRRYRHGDGGRAEESDRHRGGHLRRDGPRGQREGRADGARPRGDHPPRRRGRRSATDVRGQRRAGATSLRPATAT